MYIDNRLDLLSSFSEHVIDIRCFLFPSLALLKSKQLRALTSPKFPLSWCTFCLLFTLNAPETSWDWDIRSLWCKTTLYLAIFENFSVQHVSKTRSWYCHIFCTIFCTPKQFFKRERSAKLIQTRNRPRQRSVWMVKSLGRTLFLFLGPRWRCTQSTQSFVFHYHLTSRRWCHLVAYK